MRILPAADGKGEEAEVETNVYRPSATCYAHKSAHSSPSTTMEGGQYPKVYGNGIGGHRTCQKAHMQ